MYACKSVHCCVSWCLLYAFMHACECCFSFSRDSPRTSLETSLKFCTDAGVVLLFGSKNLLLLRDSHGKHCGVICLQCESTSLCGCVACVWDIHCLSLREYNHPVRKGSVYVCISVYTRKQKLEVNLKCHFSSIIYLIFFLRQSLSVVPRAYRFDSDKLTG